MKVPESTQQISLAWNANGKSIYPPLGFVPFAENQLGNGDTFGVYWPLGRENQEPIVAETQHDTWTIAPSFSSLSAFLRKASGSDEWVEPPTLTEDPSSPTACLQAARASLEQNGVEEAIALLERTITLLPEFGEAQWTLSRARGRNGEIAAAFEPALRAVIAPPSLGGVSAAALNWLQRQETCPDDIAADSVWIRRKQLRYKFGGTKDNSDYGVLREAISEYREKGDGYTAILLLQTYGELMFRETVSFRDREGFDSSEFLSQHRQWCIEADLFREARVQRAL